MPDTSIDILFFSFLIINIFLKKQNKISLVFQGDIGWSCERLWTILLSSVLLERYEAALKIVLFLFIYQFSES